MLSSLRLVERHELVLVENDFLKSEKDFLAVVVVILKMGHPRPLFRLFSSFHTDITIFTTNICEKMNIQYMVLGFEPTTFRTSFSFHNH